jgi:Permeases of the drug/metabolite transporter (DMT) superfamily
MNRTFTMRAPTSRSSAAHHHNIAMIDRSRPQDTTSHNYSALESDEGLSELEAGRVKSPLFEKSDETLKLLFCCIGVYSAYLIYGSLQEDVFTYTSSTSEDLGPFTYIWFVQVVEAIANIITGYIGRYMTSTADEIRKSKPNEKFFFFSGCSQVSSKAFTSLSLNNGLSFPLATMAKSGKMAPVMLGQLVLGGARYSTRDYLQVGAIIAGTAMLGLSKAKGDQGMAHSTTLGVIFIVASLAMDGITGGLQKRLKKDTMEEGNPLKGYDFMYYTNTYMLLVALCVSNINGDLVNGVRYCLKDPHIFSLIFKFCVCSAVGQSFIFYTIASFDPLVCSTITTTRKIVSVFLSIFYKGHVMNTQAWCGVFLACVGILSEVQAKVGRSKNAEKKDGS